MEAPPSTDTSRLAGLVVIVVCTVAAAKLPVITVSWCCGHVKFVLAEVLESNVPPVEDQLPKVNPLLAVAVTGMVAPAAK